MCSFCLLTSMELMLKPNCSLLYLHSSDMNSLKIPFMKQKVSNSYKYNCYENPQYSRETKIASTETHCLDHTHYI